VVLGDGSADVTFVPIIRQVVDDQHDPSMATIGKKFADRTHDKQMNKMLDAGTKAVLTSVLSEQRGTALDAYLRATGRYRPR
jgi:hypothetical protein